MLCPLSFTTCLSDCERLFFARFVFVQHILINAQHRLSSSAPRMTLPFIHTCICIHIYMYILCLSACLHYLLYIYMYIHIHICIYIYIYIRLCIFMYYARHHQLLWSCWCILGLIRNTREDHKSTSSSPRMTPTLIHTKTSHRFMDARTCMRICR